MPRKSTSSYARPRAVNVDPHVDTGTTGVQSKTFDTLSSQIADLTSTLVQTQKEVGDAKQTASLILSNNSELKKEIEQAKASADDACSANSLLKSQLDAQKTKRERPTSFTSKGNEQQSDSMLDIIDDLQSAKLANSSQRRDDVDCFLDKAIDALFERVRLIKIADQHPQGWAFIREYLGSGLGKDEADDRKLKAAEASLELKLKRKYEGRGNRGKRGSYHGRYDNQNGGHQESYSQAAPVFQFVNPTSGGGSGNSNATQYVQVPVKSGTSNSGFVHNSKPNHGGGKVLGPCFHCRGPHLVVNCPQLQDQTAEVQAQIVGSYFKNN
jgi:hypothetical protein